MADDHRATIKFTNVQLENFAEEFRARNNFEGCDQVDIMKCLELGWIWTLRGNKRLVFVEVDDHLMGDREAEATSDKESACIRAKKSVVSAAREFLRSGLGGATARRCIFTLAHEIAHVVLCHEFGVRGRKVGALGRANSEYVEQFESTERQANYLAGAVLIGRTRLHANNIAESVSDRFGVSLSAAKARLNQVFKKKSPVVSDGFRELRALFNGLPRDTANTTVEKIANVRKSENKSPNSFGKLGLCPQCGNNTLCESQGNYFCVEQKCRSRNVKLQDGDIFE